MFVACDQVGRELPEAPQQVETTLSVDVLVLVNHFKNNPPCIAFLASLSATISSNNLLSKICWVTQHRGRLGYHALSSYLVLAKRLLCSVRERSPIGVRLVRAVRLIGRSCSGGCFAIARTLRARACAPDLKSFCPPRGVSASTFTHILWSHPFFFPPFVCPLLSAPPCLLVSFRVVCHIEISTQSLRVGVATVQREKLYGRRYGSNASPLVCVRDTTGVT